MNTLILKKDRVKTTTSVILFAVLFLSVLAFFTKGFTTIPWGFENLKASVGSLFLPLVVSMAIYLIYKISVLPTEIAVNIIDGNFKIDGVQASADMRLTVVINQNQSVTVSLYKEAHTVTESSKLYYVSDKNITSVKNIKMRNLEILKEVVA